MPKFCTKCEHQRGGRFCYACGTRLVEDPKTPHCPKLTCRIQVDISDKFCFMCGWNLAEPWPPRGGFPDRTPGFWKRMRIWLTTIEV